MSVLAQTGLKGVVINSKTGAPIAGATVMLDDQGLTVTTGPNGDFLLTGAEPGKDVLLVIGYGFKDWSQGVEIFNGVVESVGTIKVSVTNLRTRKVTRKPSAY